MKLVAPILATLLLAACVTTSKVTTGQGQIGHSKTNSTFTVTPPADAAQPTTQAVTQSNTTSAIVTAYATNETTVTATNGAVTRTKTVTPQFATNYSFDFLQSYANISPPRFDSSKAVAAQFEAMRPLQYAGIACLALGVIGGAVIAFVLKWPTLGLKLGGAVSGLGVILLVLHKVLATVSPYVFLLIGLLVVVGIVALVLDHLHVFKSGQLQVHEDGK